MRGWQRAPGLGTGDASRAWPLGDTRAGDRAGGHPWRGGGPRELPPPLFCPFAHLLCPLGGHPQPHEGLGGTGWHKSPLAAARRRARHNSSRCPRMLLITLLINPAPNERPRHTGSFLIAARPPAAAAGAVIKALTSCGSTSGRALPARLGCFVCFFFRL